VRRAFLCSGYIVEAAFYTGRWENGVNGKYLFQSTLALVVLGPL
jgi:hypothetical protein